MNEFSECPTQGAIGLLALLIQSGRLAESRLDAALARADLTFVKWRALDSLVHTTDPVPLKALPGQLHCVKSNITQLVDKLESEKLVKRVPDPDDRRVIRVELTESGVRAHEAGLAALTAATLSVFRSFSDAERANLRTLLQSLTNE